MKLSHLIESVLDPVKIDEGTFELGAFQWEYDLNTEFYSGIPIESPAELTADNQSMMEV